MKNEITSTNRNASWISLAAGLALGAVGMYFLDPKRGRRRRALVRDKGTMLAHRTRNMLDRNSRHLRNRLHGIAAETKSAIYGDDTLTNEVLSSRIKTELGRVTRHASNINVETHEGNVILSGTPDDIDGNQLFSSVKKVPGVRSVRFRADPRAL